MDVAIGLPSTIPGTRGEDLIEWAKRADAAGFSSLSTIDRIQYPNYEPLIALAGAAAVTERIRLATTIMLAPLRSNVALLAKQAASLHALSGGRVVLGVAVGAREDDYEASGIDFSGRGEGFEAMLGEIRRIWSDSGGDYAVGPDVSSQPPKLIVGGTAKASFRRAAEYGDGWVMGGGSPESFAEGRDAIEAAWKEAGRKGEPFKGALAYFSLGDNAEADAQKNLTHYYSWLGDYAAGVAASAAKDAETVRGYIQGFAAAGCDELFLFPSSSDPAQVDRLAEAAL